MKRNSMLTALCMALATGVFAQAPAGGGKGGKGGGCGKDEKALCASAEKGGKMACLAQNMDKIQNPACKEKVQKYAANDKAVKDACSKEIGDDKCTGMDIGTGLLKCLGHNKKTLSDGCKAALKTVQSEMHKGGKGKGNMGGEGAAPAPAKP
jgi:hypothetical protein